MITRATVADAALCRKLELAAYGTAATLRQWRLLLSQSSTVALCCTTGVAVVVGARVVVIAVDSKQRRKGTGKQLVTKLQEKIENLQLRLPETNTVALKFAVAVGFKVTKLLPKCYGNLDGVELEWRAKKLDPSEIAVY